MCPLKLEDLESWKHYDKTKGKGGMTFPSRDSFKDWLKLNPYELRAEGLKRNLTLTEFGRVLYHLIQRRGFWSNRKVKEEGKINTGSENKDITGISDAREKIGDTKKYPTLGAYLYDISYKDGLPYKRKLNDEGKELRVRARYTLRGMYMEEFEILWSKQADHLGLNGKTETVTKTYIVGNPYRKGKVDNNLKNRVQHRLDYLTQKGVKAHLQINETNLKNTRLIVDKQVPLKEWLGGGNTIKQEDSILFYQRSIRAQKYLLDECSLEKTVWKQGDQLIYQRKKPGDNAVLIYAGKNPCPISHPLSELRRAYEFINNIEYGAGIRLNDEQRRTVLDLINSKDRNFDFESIPKALNLEHEKFNYDNKHKVPGNYTHKHLKPLFPDDVWKNHDHEIWHCFYSFTDNDKLIEKLQNDFGFDMKIIDIDTKIKGKEDENGLRKGGISLEDGYGNLSLKAITNLLPFLEDG